MHGAGALAADPQGSSGSSDTADSELKLIRILKPLRCVFVCALVNVAFFTFLKFTDVEKFLIELTPHQMV
jgi:hypothetical protein